MVEYVKTTIVKHIQTAWLRMSKAIRYSISLLASLGLLFIILNLIFPLRIVTNYGPLVLAKDGTVMHAFLSNDDKWRMFTRLEEITPQLKQVLLFKEDRHFYRHPGVNPLAVVRAVVQNILKGERTSGASTITMQVARLIDPKPRTYKNKLIEMFRALQLEWTYSKDEILQLYFNLAPYGGNIEGIKAAALLYFEKSPDHLNLAELTVLAIIPNQPNQFRVGEKNATIKQARDRWLKRFSKAGIFPVSEITDALEEPFQAQRHEAPKEMPHLAYRLKQQYPGSPLISTLIDWNLQKRTENLVGSYIERLYHQNIRNAAVLIIDNRKQQVVTYIGSPDFNNKEASGQVDGVKAIRSPGSTLKPLLYGMAFDQGLVAPKTVISDVPVSYSGYEPENYDRQFNGLINIEYALANSLNVPAVKVLEVIGIDKFIRLLKKAGFAQIAKDANRLGLSTALGGCGVRLEELAGSYAALANQGNFRPLQWIKDDTTQEVALLSSAAAFQITEILTQVTRPDLPLQWHNTTDLPQVAWKTGTSYGRRDAWSVGYNQRYTVAVWVGNFSGQGVPELNGAAIAAPLFFGIFNTLKHPKKLNQPPESLAYRFVCSESGLVPNEFCENQIMDSFIKDISSVKKCTHKKSVWVNPHATVSYCTACRPVNGYKTLWYPNHSPEMITYFQKEQIKYQAIPTHNPECERLFTKGSPQITSPLADTEYFVDVRDSTQIMLSCNVQSDVEQVYWYVDNAFFKSAQAQDRLFFTPRSGRIKISCTDDKGRNTDVEVNVKEVLF